MKRGWITWCGLGIVAAAAAVLSFDALRQLAVMVGTHKHLAPLLPITVDAAAVVATRVWLAGEAPHRAVRFARVLALAMIGASVAGNAGAHGLVAFDVSPAWWAVVAVASVPPLVLAALVHLAHLATAGDLLGSQEIAGHGAEAENFTEVGNVSEPEKGPGSARTPGDHQAEPGSSADEDAHSARTPGAEVGGDLVDRARRLVAERGRLGRGRLARELGVTEHQARQVLTELDTGPPVRLVS